MSVLGSSTNSLKGNEHQSHQLVRDYEECRSKHLAAIKIEGPRKSDELRELTQLWEILFPDLLATGESESPAIWHCLGDAFSKGRGTRPNTKMAVQWYRHAVNAGLEDSLMPLAICLLQSESAEDHEEAVGFFRKLADAGLAEGMAWIGCCFRDGKGVNRDLGEAAHWFAKAAEAGDMRSRLHTGRCYRSLGLWSDAEKWLLKAADAGFEESYKLLAELYSDNSLPIAGAGKAVSWWGKLAASDTIEAGEAMLAIAKYYLSRGESPTNYSLARRWLRKAIDANNIRGSTQREAQRLLERIFA